MFIMAWVSILFEDEPFVKDFPPDRFSGFSLDEVMSLEKSVRMLVAYQSDTVGEDRNYNSDWGVNGKEHCRRAYSLHVELMDEIKNRSKRRVR